MTTPTPTQQSATVELRDLQLATCIGTYGPDDVVPDAHLLDLSLEIAPERVLVPEDSMARVFDYDPLIAEIDRIARAGRYETQEYLMTRIVDACARQPEITALEIGLRKRPVRGGTGSLGVWLRLGAEALAQHRAGR